MVSVDYVFYTSTYKGTKTEAEFNRELPKAIQLVLKNTNYMVADVEDDDTDTIKVNDIRMCICSVVDISSNFAKSDGKIVQSRTAGKTSESYLVSDKTSSMSSSVSESIDLWLGKYGYAGFVWV